MQVPQIKLTDDSPSLSRLALGFWHLLEWDASAEDVVKLVEQALELGITTTDHASIYGGYLCEREFGKALAAAPGLRNNIQIVTKCGIEAVCDEKPENKIGHYNTSESVIIETAENSFRNFGTDHLDLLLIHLTNQLLDADAVAEAFMKFRDQGKVLYFGVSNFRPWQLDLLQSRLEFNLVTNQVEISALEFEVMHDGTLDQCQQYHILPQAWSSFAGGRIFTGIGEKAVRVRTECQQIAEEIGDATIDQVALAFLLKHPAKIQPILGSGKIDRLRSAAGACSIELSQQQWFRIWVASKGHWVP